MSLEAYIAHRDHFELDEPSGGFALAFPCCCCQHRNKTDADEPCRTCDHNAGAVEEAPPTLVEQVRLAKAEVATWPASIQEATRLPGDLITK